MKTTMLLDLYARATGRDAAAASVTRLPGGAGNRTYWRIAGGGRSAVVMELPPEPGKSEEASKDAAPAELPFLNVRRYLEKLGVRVPQLLLDQHAEGALVIEDLGDETLEAALSSATGEAYAAIYEAAIDQLARLRARAERDVDSGCLAYGRAFDFDLYQWELEHFIEYGLLARGASPSASELATLRAAFTQISRRLAEEPRGFTHRDYQSRNIMVVGRAGGTDEQVVIDFQDALQGPRQYDLVCLLRDSYVELSRPLVLRLLRRYLERLVQEGGPRLAEEEFIGLFDLLTVQRKLKDAGRFVFIDQVKKNPSFLVHIPASLRYVKEALSRRPELAEVARILAQYVPELR